MLIRLFLLTALFLHFSSAAAEFYVATDGDDSNDGSLAKPFATLERAREAVRQLKQKDRAPRGGITVFLRGGDYLRTNSFELTTADSGEPGAPVIWRNYKDEAARLLGGRVLNGFSHISSAAVLRRLEEKARGHVIEMNLKRLGITDYGELKSRGFGRPTASSHGELFFDHRPMTLARWPNEGEFAKIAGYPAAAGHRDEHGGDLGQLNGGFLYEGDRPRQWQDTSDLWVHGYWAYDWANSYEKVASLDFDQHLVKTAAPYGIYGFRKGQRFYFLNVLEELDQPGEWFLDRKSGLLYFWPPEVPADGRPHELVFSLLDGPLLKLNGASHVTFRGLALEATRGNAVEIRGGQSDRIEGCLIRDIGDNGVVVDGGSDHGVSGCNVFDTGDGGVIMTGGDRQTLSPGGHFVENCHFQRQGRWSKCYVPAISLTGVGLRASHNLIHDHPHCAILFWGNDHLIEFNEIHHIALETGDVGAIYSGRDYTFRGNVIRYNYIHHTGGVGMGSMGVYMDDCVSGTEVLGNIFYKVHWAMFIGGGRDHRVENNLFVDCDPAVRMDGRGLDKSPVWHGMVNDTMRQRLKEVPWTLYQQHYPELKSLARFYGLPGGPAMSSDSFQGVPPENNRIARNVCVGKWLEVGWHATPEMLLLENNLTNAASSLRAQPTDQSPATDFELKGDSPAWGLGFQRMPLAQIGLQKDELRNGLKLFAELADPPTDPAAESNSGAPKAESTQKPLYVYTLSQDGTAESYDEALAVACLQGIINRASPELYLLSRKNTRPQFWLDLLSKEDRWLQGRELVPVTDIAALAKLAGRGLKGAVIWDPAVPATVNVATTIAGVEDGVVLSPEYAERYLKEWQLPVLADLRGRFTAAETGSKKNDAYRWAIREYLHKGRCSSHLLCLYEDSFSTRAHGDIGYILTRDCAVKNRAFVFDLSPWGDEKPLDDPAQPLGLDLATYKLILDETLHHSAGKHMTELTGFFAFSKYAHMPDHPSTHEPVPTEWESVWLMSPYNCYQNTISSDCFNESLHSQAPRRPLRQPRTARKVPLENKTYLCILMADYDSATPLYDFLPNHWHDKERGKIPLAWGINPNLLETYPDLIAYFYSTATPADTFTSDASAAGYMNPDRVKPEYLPLFVQHNRRFFAEADMDMAPMVLDWDEPSPAVKDAFREFAPSGLATIVMDLHGKGGKLPAPQVWKGMPVLELINNACNFAGADQTAEIMSHAINERGNKVPGFYFFRIVWVKPSDIVQTLVALRRKRPELNIEVLDPHTFFALFKEFQQRESKSRR